MQPTLQPTSKLSLLLYISTKTWQWHNLIPRVFSAFKMVTRRRPWRNIAGHVSPKILEILIVSKWRLIWLILWSRDLLFARIFFVPTRHLESGDGRGDEVDSDIINRPGSLNHPTFSWVIEFSGHATTKIASCDEVFSNRGMIKPTVHEVGWKENLVHGFLGWIVHVCNTLYQTHWITAMDT